MPTQWDDCPGALVLALPVEAVYPHSVNESVSAAKRRTWVCFLAQH